MLNHRIQNGETEFTVRKNVLDKLGIETYCCRRMFLGHIDIIDKLLLYPNNPGETTTRLYNTVPEDDDDTRLATRPCTRLWGTTNDENGECIDEDECVEDCDDDDYVEEDGDCVNDDECVDDEYIDHDDDD